MGNEVVSFSGHGNEITITGKGEGMYQIMRASFDPERLIIRYGSEGGDPSATFDIGITADGKGNLVDQKLHFGKKIPEVGREIIGYATQVPGARY